MNWELDSCMLPALEKVAVKFRCTSLATPGGGGKVGSEGGGDWKPGPPGAEACKAACVPSGKGGGGPSTGGAASWGGWEAGAGTGAGVLGTAWLSGGGGGTGLGGGGVACTHHGGQGV